MYEVKLEDVRDLALGAAFLGTGGGGDSYAARVMVEEVIRNGCRIEVIGIEQIADDGLVVPIATVGAPTIGLEKLPCTGFGKSALRKIEALRGKCATALIASEIGGFNGLFPLYVAAQSGLPVIDGDGMGRAFPESQMVTFNLAGVKATPTVVADEYGNTVVLEGPDPVHIERLVRGVVTAMGGMGCVVDYPMSGNEARTALVPGSVCLALKIGQVIRRARGTSKDPFEALSRFLRDIEGRQFADVIFSGKIVDLRRDTKGGFVFGRARIACNRDPSRSMDIRLKNEYLVACINGQTAAVVPDLICILERDSAEPISTENLKYGQRVSVFAVSAPPELCTTEALRIFGPSAFGLEEKFVPVNAASW